MARRKGGAEHSIVYKVTPTSIDMVKFAN